MNNRLQTIMLIGSTYVFCSMGLVEQSCAQNRFTLTAPQAGVSSSATLTAITLTIKSNGKITRYKRDSKYDSSDGQWAGYISRRPLQVIRWPASNRGNIQIGTVRGGAVSYRQSQMVISPISNPLAPGGGMGFAAAGKRNSTLFSALPTGRNISGAELLRFGSMDSAGLPWILARNPGLGLLNVVQPGTVGETDWWIAPAGAGMVRFEGYDRGRVVAISVQRGVLSLEPIAQDSRQLWRPTLYGNPKAQQFIVESVHVPGHCLAVQNRGQVMLQPINFGQPSLWVPLVPPSIPTFQPISRSFTHEIVPAPPLPPSEVELHNSHRYALVVLLGDRRKGEEFSRIRIEPGKSEIVKLDRDPGTVIVESFEIYTATGSWDRQEFRTSIPPTAIYDLSVYEEHLQSIAIDRTGKSPNPIEDTNYVPKSLGWLQMPAEFDDKMRIDLYSKAKAANNPGAVRRLDPKEFEPTPANPLEAILKEHQSNPKRDF